MDVAFTPAARLAELLRDGAITARELAQIHLERIERLNPTLNAYRATNRYALDEADAADARLKAGDPSPLLGLPIAVKDNLAVKGEVTTHGTSQGAAASDDCAAVKRLRDAGAVILGLTTLPELALWPHHTESPTFGATRNPYDPGRSPGGSSGGSAVAVAAGLAAAALGTDGGGSIRVPAAFTGLVGLKPQRDRLSLAPDEGHWRGLTHLGVLARTAEDAALVAGLDLPAPRTRLRIAVSTKTVLPAKPHADVRAALARVVALARELGHDTFERDPDYGDLRPLFVPRYLRGAYEDAQRIGGDLEPRVRSAVRLGRRMGRLARRAQAAEPARAARINRVFAGADVLMTPATAAPAPEIGAAYHRSGVRTILAISPYAAYTIPWNVTGQPALVVPAGTDATGVPLGVQLVGRPGDEATILGLAAQLESRKFSAPPALARA